MSWLRSADLRLLIDERRMIVHHGNFLHLAYHHDPASGRPYISTLIGPSGRNLLEDMPPDHIHHHGVWWGHGDVNGVDFYLEPMASGRRFGTISHTGYEQVVDECPRFGAVSVLEWRTDSGEVLIEERRGIHASFADASHYVVDLDSTYLARRDLTFGDTRESSMPGIRMAEALTGVCGGTITNSQGASGEDNTMGRPAQWVDYSGPRTWVHKQGAGVEGIACFDHPSNPFHPPAFFTRAYGPFCPFQGHYFLGPGTLDAGRSWRFRHRLLVHAGDVTEAGVAQRYAEWVAGDAGAQRS